MGRTQHATRELLCRPHPILIIQPATARARKWHFTPHRTASRTERRKVFFGRGYSGPQALGRTRQEQHGQASSVISNHILYIEALVDTEIASSHSALATESAPIDGASRSTYYTEGEESISAYNTGVTALTEFTVRGSLNCTGTMCLSKKMLNTTPNKRL